MMAFLQHIFLLACSALRGWAKAGLRHVAVIALAMMAFAHAPSFAQTILRVDGLDGLTTGGGATGNDWDHAFKYLQDALADVDNQSLPVEIWVRGRPAGVIYRPDQSSAEKSGQPLLK